MTASVLPVVPGEVMSGQPQPVITFRDGFQLRPFHEDDAASVLLAFSTPDIQYWHCRRQESIAQAQLWIAEANRRWTAATAANWAITRASESTVLGRVGINADLHHGCGEVAYWVLPEGRGQSLAAGAAVAATAWAHAIGIHRIKLQHSTRNERSGRVAVKAGFTSEGIQREAGAHEDGWHDMHLYSHLASDQKLG